MLAVPMGMRTQAIAGQLGVNGQLDVNFAGIIQSALLNLQEYELEYHWEPNSEVNFCLVTFLPAAFRCYYDLCGPLKFRIPKSRLPPK
jgi:hypothetical protein